jgi:uncharacterized protein DUF695
VIGRTKAKPTVAEAAAADEWVVLQGTFDGQPMFARFNTGYRDASDREQYAVQVAVVIPFNEPNEHGMPQQSELEQLDQIEDLVDEKSRDRAVFVGVFTTTAIRQFMLYTEASDWVASFHQELQAAVTTHEVECMAVRDPDWNHYRTFVG